MRSSPQLKLAACATALAFVVAVPGPARAGLGDCGQPATTGPFPTASDSLFTLGAAVGVQSCLLWICDVNDDGVVTASDALAILRAAVGLGGGLLCPAPPTTTTTTVGPTTTTTVPQVEVYVFSNACVEAVLSSGLLPDDVALRGPGSATVEIDLGTLGDADGDGLEEVTVQVTDLLFMGEDSIGVFTASLQDTTFYHVFQQRLTVGTIEENVNNTPGVLDLPPHAPTGSATIAVDAWIQAEILGDNIDTRVHHDVSLDLVGTITNDPPLPGESVAMQNVDPIQVVNDFDVDFFGTTINMLSLDLTATSCDPIE